MSRRDELATTEGVLTGAALAAAAAWIRYDNDRNRRLRNVTADATAVSAAFRDFTSRGDVIRAQMPVIQDAQAGLSIANQVETPPTLTPTNVNQSRPDLAKDREENAKKLSFPPIPGVYTDTGLIEKVGELAAVFSALTYQETRAAILGLVQHDEPNDDAKIQISRAFHGLNKVLYGTNLSLAQFVQVWTTLFAGSTTPGGQVDPHLQLTPAPSIIFVDTSIASTSPLGAPDIPALPAHKNYDRAFKFRLNVGSNPMPANTNIATIQFGTPWTRDGAPYIPVVLIQNAFSLVVAQVNPANFSIRSNFSAPAGSVIDIGFAAVGG